MLAAASNFDVSVYVSETTTPPPPHVVGTVATGADYLDHILVRQQRDRDLVVTCADVVPLLVD